MYIMPAKPITSGPAKASQRELPFYSDREDVSEPQLPQVLMGQSFTLRCDSPTCAGIKVTAVLTIDAVPRRPRTAWIGTLSRGVVKMLAALEQEFQVRRAVRELSQMDNQTLYDIGIERGGIEHAVRHGRDFD